MWRLTALYGGSLFILPLRVIIVLGCRIWEDENGGSQTETVPLEMVEINTKSTNHTRQVFFFSAILSSVWSLRRIWGGMHKN